MPAIHEHAVCIRRQDWSETSQTVTLLTRGQGLVRGLVKGAKREKGAFSGGLELLTLGEVGLVTKPERDLATVTDWDLREVFPALRSDWLAHTIGVYLADLLQSGLESGDPHPRLFERAVETLRRIGSVEARRSERWAALLRFQQAFLEEIGYRPELDADVETGEKLELSDEQQVLAFKPAAGGLVRDLAGRDRWRVRLSTIRILRNPDHAGTGPEAEAGLTRANRLLAAYLRETLGRESPAAGLLFGRSGDDT
jgi:DNA repair protein RecO (recombination protein O)